MKIKLLSLIAPALALWCSVSLLAAAEPMKKLLVVTTTAAFRHSSIPTAEQVLSRLAAESGAFTVDFVRQPDGKPAPLKPGASPEQQTLFKLAQEAWEAKLKQALMKLSPESLKDYDGVVFASTSGDLPIPDREGFLNWLRSGKAFIGIHAASDTFHGWPEFIAMLGGEFKIHGAQVGVDCLNEDPQHPANAALGKIWTIPQEEIYQFTNYVPANVHELLIMDRHPNNKTPGHYPVSWCREFGRGKVFYTSLGHREDIWDTDPNLPNRKNPAVVSKAFQTHVRGGIEWALGIASHRPETPANR